MVWRIILERIATLEEIETHYSLLDLLDANIALDFKEEMIDKANKPKGNK